MDLTRGDHGIINGEQFVVMDTTYMGDFKYFK